MNEQQQHKPISLVREELINKIIQAINESGLSYFVLEYIFKDLYSEIHDGAVKQAQREQEEYQRATQAKEQEQQQ